MTPGFLILPAPVGLTSEVKDPIISDGRRNQTCRLRDHYVLKQQPPLHTLIFLLSPSLGASLESRTTAFQKTNNELLSSLK